MKGAIIGGVLAAAGAAAFAQAPSPPTAVLDAQTRVSQIVVYGNDPCPTSGPEDIIVCARRPEADRFRIPEQFRENPQRRVQESWAVNAQALEYVGRTGIHSCTPVGAGGWTGCWEEMMRQARRDENVSPEGIPVP